MTVGSLKKNIVKTCQLELFLAYLNMHLISEKHTPYSKMATILGVFCLPSN